MRWAQYRVHHHRAGSRMSRQVLAPRPGKHDKVFFFQELTLCRLVWLTSPPTRPRLLSPIRLLAFAPST